MRDALSVLDQLISYAGGQEGKLTADLVRELTGAIEEERLLEVLEQTAAGQTAPAIESLASIIDAGIDPGELGDALIERVRELTLLATCGDKADLIIYTGELQKRAAALSEQMGIDRLLYTLRLLSDARREAQSATHARVPLELAILRLSRTGDLADLGELAGNVAALVKSGLPPAAEPSGNPKSGADAPNTEASRSRPLHRTAPAPAAVPTPAPAQPSPAATNAPTEPTLARVKEVWPQALQKLNPRHRGRVQEAVVTGLEGRQVMLRLPSSKAFTVGHLRKVGAPQQLAAALSEVLGVDVEVDFDSSADLEPADEPSPPPNNEPQLPDGEEIRRRAREAGRAADPEEHPTVQAALSKLKGRIRAKERGLGPEGRS
jgi:DNA polymerase-3 subunit gamma/tau